MKSDPTPWFKQTYRRNVVDMHIPDWDERFLSEVDPVEYVRLLKLAHVQSTVLYANSCVGLCFYPTDVGAMHKGLKGRNLFGELLDECHRHDISVVGYYGLIFDNWAWENHPGWRIIDVNGTEAEPPHKLVNRHRFKIVCPNSPYREYVHRLTREITGQFEVDGIRFDMTFWPCPCYCRHCRQRFADEVGGELPTVIDWTDRRWVAFQRKREQWLNEFARMATDAVKQIKPHVSVEHQASTFIQSWRSGINDAFSACHDFLQGDFYGDKWQGTFARKVFYNLSENLPYGFETSFCADITDHTAKKSNATLETKAFASLAEGGAFVFIDGIDPIGTLNPSVYHCMADVFAQTRPFEPYLGGEQIQDIAVYFSCESKFDFADRGKAADDPTAVVSVPHVRYCLALCQVLSQNHLTYGVITKRNLEALSRHKILVLPNVLMMDEHEVEAIRAFVAEGGKLLAGKYTSLFSTAGEQYTDFMLADVFGVSYLEETHDNYTYMAPLSEQDELFGTYTRSHPLSLCNTQLIVCPSDGVEVIGEIVLPYVSPQDHHRFASQHSYPPGIYTGHPAITRNRFGRGDVIYLAGDLSIPDTHGETLIQLLRLFGCRFTFEAQAPRPVQLTAFAQIDRHRLIVNLLNHQMELPNIPVQDIQVRGDCSDKTVKRVFRVGGERPIPYTYTNGFLEFSPGRLDTFAMCVIEFD